MNKAYLHERIHIVLLAAIACTISFPIKLNSILITLCAVNWLLEGNLVEKVKRTIFFPVNVYWMIFFGLHIISYFISINQHEAGAILERRLSLFAFPLLIYGSVTPRQTRHILFSFVGGVIVSLLFCYLKAFEHFVAFHQAYVFFYHDLTSAVQINAVYMSAYTVFAIHILLDRADWTNPLKKTVFIAALIFLFVSCLMLSSKMMLFVLMIGLIINVFRSGSMMKYKLRALGIVGGIVLTIFATVLMVPQTRERFMTEWGSDFSVLSNEHYTHNTHFTGTSLRLRIWEFCVQILNEQQAWIQGVGTGDFQDLLNEKYITSGMYTGNVQLHDTGYLGYGPHSEYMEVLFSMGVLALLFFLYILFMQWYMAIKSNHYLLIQLLLLITLFFTTESVLSTNKGIVFLLFFVSLLGIEQLPLSRKEN